MSEESKVRLWIWGGFLSVLVLLAVVGAVSYFSFEGTVDKFAESGRVGQSTVQVLLGDRNRRWLPQILDLLDDDRDYLVVVGALHIVGREGLLSLLKQRGYSASQQ